jgi:hypothetical protein
LTTDEVNLALADQLATECGAILYLLSFQDGAPNAASDAVLYDWDYLSSEWREKLLAELLSRPAPCPVALHGYSLEEEHGEALRRHGVGVFRRLEPEVFLNLRRVADQARDTSSASQGEGLKPAAEKDFVTASPSGDSLPRFGPLNQRA